MFKRKIVVCGLFILMLWGVTSAWAEEAPPEVFVKQLNGPVYMLPDSAGLSNMALFKGQDGVLIVDSKMEFLLESLKAKIAEISDKPVQYLVSTHPHPDHVDGNRGFVAGGTIIIAHQVAYETLLKPQHLAVLEMAFPALTPETGLPGVTFTDKMNLYMDGSEIQLIRLGAGHSGGDLVVFFKDYNVLHVADLMFNGTYPYVGINEGGSLNYMIAMAPKALELMDDKTIIIPGHGEPTNKAEFIKFYEMLTAVRDKIAAAVAAGKTMEEVIAMKPTAEFDGTYGAGQPLSPDDAVKLYYMDLVRFK